MRSVVAGKLFNVHSENDYILGFLYRGTSLQLGIAGLQAVGTDIEGVEDLDLSEEVHGHLRYPRLIPQILHRCGFVGVRGGDVAIEKDVESSEISMSDRDYPQLGNLIDVGDGSEDEAPPVLPPRRIMSMGNEEKSGSNEEARPVLPPRRTISMRNEEMSGSVAENVAEQKADIPTSNAKLVGGHGAIANPEKGGKSSSLSSTSDLSENCRGNSMGIGERFTSTSYRTTHSQTITSSGGRRLDDDDDDEEYGEGRIIMMDNDDLSDGELTVVEPLSIDDDAPTQARMHR
ncbi:hypothetical protein CIB48_g11381 [Xylaria polymorpha]|nr:hypothetical protein CIB48_g11381 [Xylaria polymorpha]